MSEHILLAVIGLMAAMIIVMVGWCMYRLDSKLDRLITNYDNKFDGISGRLGGVEQAAAGLSGRVDAFGQRLSRNAQT